MDSYMEMKHFLDYNNMAYNTGTANIAGLFIEYKIGDRQPMTDSTNIIFSVENFANDRILMPDLDEKVWHTGFNDKWLTFTFNEDANTLTIKPKTISSKHNDFYKVIIYG